jgi:hypothetical protein
LYKLIGELPFLLPEAKYRIKDDFIITRDHQVVEIAKYVFQFQPDLLVIEHLVSTQKNNAKTGKKQADLVMPSVLELI